MPHPGQLNTGGSHPGSLVSLLRAGSCCTTLEASCPLQLPRSGSPTATRSPPARACCECASSRRRRSSTSATPTRRWAPACAQCAPDSSPYTPHAERAAEAAAPMLRPSSWLLGGPVYGTRSRVCSAQHAAVPGLIMSRGHVPGSAAQDASGGVDSNALAGPEPSLLCRVLAVTCPCKYPLLMGCCAGPSQVQRGGRGGAPAILPGAADGRGEAPQAHHPGLRRLSR